MPVQKEDLLGKFDMMISTGSSMEEWAKIKPTSSKLLSSSGATVGEISYRLRHECKLLGIMQVDLEGGQLMDKDIKAVKAVLKHVNKVVQSPTVPVKDSRFEFKWVAEPFTLDAKNNVFDIFIEIWENDPGQILPPAAKESVPTAPIPENNDKKKSNPLERMKMVGQARLPLFDAKSLFHSSLPIHTDDHKHVGDIMVKARMVQGMQCEDAKKESKEFSSSSKGANSSS